ncbi:lipid-A-disaccharide synthase-related protein [Oscillatoria sp. CS-180]|uniref:lipid-A-disaccharide synthase-related protein n=1 Tax=Oscillatoria sp. CS-180 TaxID=3021720 RepID=UPI00232BA888|nr:lipid-A-disaccharide synthase-related protein [Oscillatoria sp. CS-180]MDB9526100.1 lipid-A-disaccharide synthase-related protein [Oscillatoria sp. CS-180]
MPKRVLFISNGHGEDNHSAYVIRTLRELAPDVEIAAIPIVGEGNAYRRLGVPILGPTKVLPSGGFTYVNRWLLVRDIRAGLLGLTWRQFRAIRHYGPQYDLVHATGDSVGQTCAYLTGRPFISFISCLSALYEGRLQTDFVMRFVVRSSRCQAIVTRDPYTAEDLAKQGFDKVHYGGIPSLDWLLPHGKDLSLKPEVPMVALLPGSRMPEAVRNFKLQIQFVEESVRLIGHDVQFRAALVPALMAEIGALAAEVNWNYKTGRLWRQLEDGTIAEILCYDDAFNDIVYHTTLVIGMAGLAVDQAVAIGKPVIQIPGEGPQFNYAFAEAQDRLLGLSAQTIGTGPANHETLKEAAQCLQKTLYDKAYLSACVDNGRARLGIPGASKRIAQLILDHLQVEPMRVSANAMKQKRGTITP